MRLSLSCPSEAAVGASCQQEGSRAHSHCSWKGYGALPSAKKEEFKCPCGGTVHFIAQRKLWDEKGIFLYTGKHTMIITVSHNTEITDKRFLQPRSLHCFCGSSHSSSTEHFIIWPLPGLLLFFSDSHPQCGQRIVPYSDPSGAGLQASISWKYSCLWRRIQCKAVIEKAGAEVCILICKAEIRQLDY